MVNGKQDRVGWTAFLFPTGDGPTVGAVRGSRRLHWSQEEAKRQAEEWASEMEVGPLSWNCIDDKAAIAWVDNNNHSKYRAFVVRSIMLPLGDHRLNRAQWPFRASAGSFSPRGPSGRGVS